MKNIWNRMMSVSEVSGISQVYGTFIALGLIAYFFAMYAIGLIHTIELRLLNLFILMVGVYFAMKQFKRNNDGRLDYFRSIVAGVATSLLASATFALFLFIYLSLDKNLMNAIAANEPLGLHLNPYISGFMVFLEGLFSGLFVSYLLSNFLSTDTPTVDRSVDDVARRVPKQA